jgi:hypothetical protein
LCKLIAQSERVEIVRGHGLSVEIRQILDVTVYSRAVIALSDIFKTLHFA